MDPTWLDILGLIIAMTGAIVLSGGMIVSRKHALEIGVSRLGADTDELNINLPHVRNKQRESRLALIGMILLVFGFLLQIAGNWPR